jgi:hypothetical protein
MRSVVLIIAGDSGARTTIKGWIASAGYAVRRLDDVEGAREAAAASDAVAAIDALLFVKRRFAWR